MLIQGVEWFNEVNAKKVSSSIVSITKWCYALYEYHEKSQIVKPKRIKLALEEGKLAIALENLERSRQQLAEIKA
jgi:dynein heavy chain